MKRQTRLGAIENAAIKAQIRDGHVALLQLASVPGASITNISSNVLQRIKYSPDQSEVGVHTKSFLGSITIYSRCH